MASTLKRLNLTQAANQSRSHPSMSVTWNLVSDRAREEFPRVFQDTQAKCAGNEIHADCSDRARGYRRGGAFESRNILPNVLMSRMESRRVDWFSVSRRHKIFKTRRTPKTLVTYAFLRSLLRFPVKSLSSRKKI
jgi:hypothetical protein